MQIEIASWIREISVQCYVKPIYERKSRNMYIAPATRNLPLSFFQSEKHWNFQINLPVWLFFNAMQLNCLFFSHCLTVITHERCNIVSSSCVCISFIVCWHVYFIFWRMKLSLFITLSYQEFMLTFDSRNDYSYVYY